MSRHLQKLPGEPIILETLSADYSLAELAAGQAEGQRLLAEQTQPVIWVADMTQAPRSFLDPFLHLIAGMLSRGQQVQPPNLRQIVYVLPADILQALEVHLSIPMFDQLAAALQYARSQSAS